MIISMPLVALIIFWLAGVGTGIGIGGLIVTHIIRKRVEKGEKL